ncbi:hypothetical protein BGY98DRAFT_962338, partial [Russula aff. rugulosa BPL654]
MTTRASSSEHQEGSSPIRRSTMRRKERKDSQITIRARSSHVSGSETAPPKTSLLSVEASIHSIPTVIREGSPSLT